MEFIVQEGNVQSRGYGIIPKLVMQDNRLTIESKGIYAYLASYCGGGLNQAFPSVKTIISHLNISEKRFQSHVKTLKELGYITVEKKRDNAGAFLHNIYIINQYVEEEKPSGQNLPVDNLMVDRLPVGNLGTNNNNNNINKYNKNNICIYNDNEKLAVMTKLYESNLGLVNNVVSDWIMEVSKNIDVDLFKKAIDICVSKGNYNLGYIKGIIRNWTSKNIKSIEDIKHSESRSKSNRKTNFHNFKETFNKYTEEELEDIIMKNQKLKWS